MYNVYNTLLTSILACSGVRMSPSVQTVWSLINVTTPGGSRKGGRQEGEGGRREGEREREGEIEEREGEGKEEGR